ncbi:glycosyltransferase [Rahnella sp. Lac-M11]|jgi:colanic acid/amylovoran biosynthesis glycosyltransferase|uniref:Glycosyltransferase n=2 Tax=Rahnella TaxID=34037 RepID=A0A6M2B444_9GAMM|nr:MULTISPECIES: glycosyltransferase [Rahnella]NGX87669.1 glycosyltransferase [Rahnella contaminans]
MKVSFFVYKFPVASETFIINQIAYFIKKGIDVEVVSVFPGEFNIKHKSLTQYRILDKVRFLLDKEPDSKGQKLITRVIAATGALTNKKAFESLNFKKYGYYAKTLILSQILSKNSRKIKSDINIAHFGTTAALLNQLKRLGFVDGKIAAVFHGNDISQKRILNLFHSDYEQLFNDANYIFPVSELWASKIALTPAIKNKTHVIRMGVNISKFIYKERITISYPIKLLSIARLTEKKGISVAINACLLLKQQNVDFDYTIIGDGPLRKELESQVTNLGLGDKIAFLGAQTQETVSEYLNNSDVFLLPSVTASDGDMEGIPVALMEAMAIGIPVISTFHSGIPELIEDRVSGFLVNENDAASIAGVISEIIDNPGVLPDICRNAKQTIDNEFDQDKSYSRMLNILLGLPLHINR